MAADIVEHTTRIGRCCSLCGIHDGGSWSRTIVMRPAERQHLNGGSWQSKRFASHLLASRPPSPSSNASCGIIKPNRPCESQRRHFSSYRARASSSKIQLRENTQIERYTENRTSAVADSPSFFYSRKHLITCSQLVVLIGSFSCLLGNAMCSATPWTASYFMADALSMAPLPMARTQVKSSFLSERFATSEKYSRTHRFLSSNNMHGYPTERLKTTALAVATDPSTSQLGASNFDHDKNNSNDTSLGNNSKSDNNSKSNNNSNKKVSYQAYTTNNSANAQIPFDTWLDRTTARLLNMPPPSDATIDDKNENSSNKNGKNKKNKHSRSVLESSSSSFSGYIPTGQLTPDDVQLITTLMTSHARRGSVESALICERLLKRVVEEVNMGNRSVRVTTKMYTVAMDAWAKSQRRPLPGTGASNRGDSSGAGAGGEAVGSSAADNDALNGQQKEQQQQWNQQSSDVELRNQQQQKQQKGAQLPLGAAAQRAHRIHNSLVQTYKATKDPHLAPSTISYNAAINAWSKSYHPSAGEMAELLLGEMIREWRFGEDSEDIDGMDDNLDDDGYDDEDADGVDMGIECFGGDDESEESQSDDENERDNYYSNRNPATSKQRRGNSRVKPDVVTFTAVIDAWVKCTALAHDYHYELPNDREISRHQQQEKYVEWKRAQAAKADALTQRAATRAKQLLNLMIQLGHYDPKRHGNDKGREHSESDGQDISLSFTKCEPSMRPNCYTYSAVMNALAKSCSALRVHAPQNDDGGNADGELAIYNPPREAQDMLESMILKYKRYRERVGEAGVWGNTRHPGYNYINERDNLKESMNSDQANLEEEGYVEAGNDLGSQMAGNSDHWKKSSSSPSLSNDNSAARMQLDEEEGENLLISGSAQGPTPIQSQYRDPHWFEPRPDEITFPPNTINYNSVLNAWSRASRYDSYSAMRAEQILLERMERPLSEGGDAVDPDVLSYSLVIHAWLRGCRGGGGVGMSRGGGNRTANSGRNRGDQSSDRKHQIYFTDDDRIKRALKIVKKMEAWARKTQLQQWNGKGMNDDLSNDDEDDSYSDEFLEGYDSGENDDENEDGTVIDNDKDDEESQEFGMHDQPARVQSTSFQLRQHNKSRDLDVEVYNAVLLAWAKEGRGDHSASVMRLLDKMESLADELGMPSVLPNKRSYNTALDIISKAASNAETPLADYYENDNNVGNRDGGSVTKNGGQTTDFRPLYAGRAAESILGKMLDRGMRPDAYTFASVLNTYQRIPNGRLDAALAADAVVRGMESLHLHGRIDQPPDVFHYTMVCACWSRSGEQGVAGERCSEILRHMHERDKAGYPRVRPNIRTYNAVIDAHAYSGRVGEAEDMLFSMLDSYESSAARSIDGIEDEEIPVRPDSFSFNTVIQQWARSRTPEGGRRAEYVLERMLKFHYNGNSDVRPDERSFAYIIFHYCKGAGRSAPDAPDRALALIRKMIQMHREGYKELLPSSHNKTNPIFAFTSVIDAHSILRRPDSGVVADELLAAMEKLGDNIEALKPNTYVYLSVLYAWSSCGTVEAGERAVALLQHMEDDMKAAAERGEDSMLRTTQRCYILAQTAWARSPSMNKAEGALKVLKMMEAQYDSGNDEAMPTVQAYAMVS